MKASDEAEFVEHAGTAAPRLRRTAYLLCRDWHRAENATQEALTRLYARWEKIDRAGGLTTYCRRVLVSVLLDQGKKASRRERAIDPVDEVTEVMQGATELEHDGSPRACPEPPSLERVRRCVRSQPAGPSGPG